MKHVLYFTRSIFSFGGIILYINLLGMVLISLLEGIGLLVLLPLLQAIGVLDSQSHVSFLAPLYQYTESYPQLMSLPAILAYYVLLVVGQALLQRRQSLLNARIQQSYAKELRIKTYRALLQAKYSLFLRKRKSDISNFLTLEISRVTAGVSLLLQFFTSIIFSGIQILIAFWLSFQLTSLILVSGLVLLLVSRRFLNRSKAIGTEISQISEGYMAAITDHFNGIRDIKGNNLEENHISWFSALCAKMEHNHFSFVKVRSASQSVFKISAAVLIAGFIYASVHVFKIHPGELILIILIFSRLWPQFTSFQSNLEQLYSLTPAFQRLQELHQECEDNIELSEEQLTNHEQPLSIASGIACRDVYFRYDETKLSYALKDIHIFIPKKQMTAIVGKSGAGKSTLIDLLTGLIEPEKGEVLIDGSPLSNHNLLALRRSVSYVSQDPFLFNTSIRENLLLVTPEASEDEMWEALAFASADDFVRNLPRGLDTMIGDRGIRLSGGERQRLVLARAVLKKPSILVLDEATSSLDTENERRIQEALERIKGKMTVIVIAHRLSTIQNADQVIVLDQGRIVQQGDFRVLAQQKKGVFSHLLGDQLQASL
ncbi:multidrug ABC transporter [Ammoniphilus oxalaticus]|uniref:Multidrug ABC transporter n=1 Tax=Ammoniphilus oxalaticus TaxID=66863 RepID=A0A419SHC9_9BACL|nr:ABC transporter ATP-binding protein [Ammoniphilus oxalaticus]RKD23187.1 multidrug ABC transporter [Ammoniphilus oxalaticus]